MRVDMSCAAVTDRLTLLGELWELSVELMQAKPQKREATVLSERSLPEHCDTPAEDDASQRQAELATELV